MYIARACFHNGILQYRLLCFQQLNNNLILWNNRSGRSNNYCKSAAQNMSTLRNLIKPPEAVRGMTVLDKSKFDTPVTVPFLNIKDVKISDVIPFMKKYCLKMQHIKPLQSLVKEPHDNKHTGLLLNPGIINIWTDIDNCDRDALQKLSITEADLSTTNITIKYENFLANDVFKAVLPSENEGFSSFSQVGHILHLNLREHLFPYKNLIANVLLDKIPNTRTVINKIDIIDNTYRNFKNEVLCGDHNMMVKIKENRCEFEFDFSKIYWNPRLSTEHERIVKLLNPNDVLFDVFAGVGPFSIPAAKKKCVVFANDLNPDSYKWLNHNSKANKIDPQYLKTFNKDGRDFIISDLKLNLINYINKHNVNIVMNLPALAVEFLSAFCDLYDADEISEIVNPPIVHVYCFAKGENYEQIAKDLVFKNIGFDINDKIINIFKVRTVSSFKEMMRVSFKLDRDILVSSISNKRKQDESILDDEISSKRCCHINKEDGNEASMISVPEENYNV
ncbi:hypothetical protein ILUMI_11955 [Ignelater luminosus]|uniref:tRNA (guanine(37)-N1)-methyltransferase n=1 Tax=Ignelater luminosus TaxID=2038154 RepID=A0A8K0CV62_IGNLU|nr:hypothetical protein ILUMI_11955 [Ignelater luminosus]